MRKDVHSLQNWGKSINSLKPQQRQGKTLTIVSFFLCIIKQFPFIFIKYSLPSQLLPFHAKSSSLYPFLPSLHLISCQLCSKSSFYAGHRNRTSQLLVQIKRRFNNHIQIKASAVHRPNTFISPLISHFPLSSSITYFTFIISFSFKFGHSYLFIVHFISRVCLDSIWSSSLSRELERIIYSIDDNEYGWRYSINEKIRMDIKSRERRREREDKELSLKNCAETVDECAECLQRCIEWLRCGDIAASITKDINRVFAGTSLEERKKTKELKENQEDV